MGGNISKSDDDIQQVQTVSSILTPQLKGKVRLYSKDNFKGNVYEIDYGNYTSRMFIRKISPDNVFSFIVPSNTSIKLYSGDMYDFGGKGTMHIVNVTNEFIKIPIMPENIRGNVRSLSISYETDIQQINTNQISAMINKPNITGDTNSQHMLSTQTNLESFHDIFYDHSRECDYLLYILLIIIILCIYKNR
jgi:hypothetical protein